MVLRLTKVMWVMKTAVKKTTLSLKKEAFSGMF